MKNLTLLTGILLLSAGYNAQAQDTESEQESPAERFVPTSLGADANEIVAGLNGFGVDLYHAVASQKGDLAISPASVSTAFGLAYAGAKGRTAEEIAVTLHYPRNLADFHGSFGGLLKTMRLSANGRTLAVNNAIWLQTELPVHDSYRALVEQHYGAGLQRADYLRDPSRALLTINGWVETNTRNRIRNLLSPNDVNGDTKSVLVNTIYFKADWSSPFEKSETTAENFTLASGQRQRQDLMHQRNYFAYVEQAGVKALGLTYRGGETEMVVLLSNSANGLAALERSLTAQTLQEWFNRLDNTVGSDVIVTLPKFKIEKRYALKDTLMGLGMVTPFSDQSDFSGMKPVNIASDDPNDWNLKIGKVIHQVFVEVEEKGTEAAAATAIIQIAVTGTRRSKPPPPKIFRADHPFLFMIRDRRTRAILFMGRYTGEPAG